MEERRKYKRLNRKYIVSYQAYGKKDTFEISQMKDISEGGMRFMTGMPFEKDTVLVMEFKTPTSVSKFRAMGKVIESKTIVEGLIYETRVCFTDLDEETTAAIRQIVDYFLMKIKGEEDK